MAVVIVVSAPAAAQADPCPLVRDDDVAQVLGTTVHSELAAEPPSSNPDVISQRCNLYADDDDNTFYYFGIFGPVFGGNRVTPYLLVQSFAQQSSQAVIDQINLPSQLGTTLTVQSSNGQTYDVTPVNGVGDAAILYKGSTWQSSNLDFARGRYLLFVNAHPDKPLDKLMAVAKVLLSDAPQL